MTDHELLKLAAKAIGLSFASQNVTSHGVYCNDATWWSPLTDDGDALRLAVKLNLGISIPVRKTASVDVVCFGNSAVNMREVGTDLYVTTRRAIVRAAAEIGKHVKE